MWIEVVAGWLAAGLAAFAVLLRLLEAGSDQAKPSPGEIELRGGDGGDSGQERPMASGQEAD
ncbi:hypothetical protein [Paenibacillus validus]|uniref:Uncharacterized protein n=1 Tax=Paenibacillus validus TaxID=44253 RepID=A0A7X2ZAG4_9BACL|nr:hypothetical protein [Paenibacillus validus]MED4605365.1 hypothetical protein [Paenibacillus validus]MUG71237.1 hypothetical protein [Paenibacillus validus]